MPGNPSHRRPGRRLYRRFAWVAAAFLFAVVLVVAFAPKQAAQEEAVTAGQSAQPSADSSSDPGSISEGAAIVSEQGASSGSDSADEKERYEQGVVLVQLAEGVSASELNDALASVGCVREEPISEDDVVLGYVEVPLAEGAEVADAISELVSLSEVQSSQPNYLYYAAEGESGEGGDDVADSLVAGQSVDTTFGQAAVGLNDAYADKQWMLDSIKAKDAWETVKADGRATVAVLDTGCKTDHPDLQPNIVQVYDASGAGIDDLSGHGTHVCGIVAAQANNNEGVAGVSYNAQLLPIQVFQKTNSEPTASTSSLVKAYNYILSNRSIYNIRVANLSLGVPVSSEAALSTCDYSIPEEGIDKALYSAVQQAREEGVLTTCAVGNERYKTTSGSVSINKQPYYNFPSDYLADIALNVIALTQSGTSATVAYYSNYNMPGQNTKEISAPGTSILSTSYSASYYDSEIDESTYYEYKQGTSMAAPCVAGVAALLFSANPDLTPDQVESILCSQDNVTDLGTEGWDEVYGAGEVNAAAAVAGMGTFLDGSSSILKGGSCALTPVSDSGSGDWAWSSNDESVATVEGGVVTGVGGGTAVISAMRGDTTVSRSVTVYDISFSGPSRVCVDETIELVINKKPDTGKWLIELEDNDIANVVDGGAVEVTGVRGGSTKVVATLASNRDLKVSWDIEVDRIDFSQAEVSMQGWTYDGCEHEPSVTVEMNGALIPSSEYAISYSGNKNAGTCVATVTPADDSRYEGVARGECAVAKRPVVLTSKSASQAYNGAVLTAEGVEIGGLGFVEGEVSDVLATGSISAIGSVANAITFTRGESFKEDNYDITYNEGTLTVTDSDLSGAAVSGLRNLVYSGSELVQDPIVVIDGIELKADVDYEVATSNNVNVGSATVTVSGKGGYRGKVSSTFEITPASIENATISGLVSKTYTGKTIEQTPVVKLGSASLMVGADYTVSYADNKKAGTATVTVTGKGNYVGTAKATFKIKKAANTIKVVNSQKAVYYSKVKKGARVVKPLTVKAAKGTVSYAKVAKSSSAKLVVNKATGKVTVKKGTKRGTYKVRVKVTAAGNANYKAYSKTFTCKVRVK